jgi:predicted anti-sigma-YlaC factor YlaD
MTCQAARQMIQDSLDGALPQAIQDELQQHLAGCESCSQDQASLSAAVTALEALPRVTAPPELLSRLSPELDALAAPAKTPRRRAAWAWAPGGAIAAGLLIALSLTRLQPAVSPPPDQLAMEPPSSAEILQWLDASADPAEILPF